LSLSNSSRITILGSGAVGGLLAAQMSRVASKLVLWSRNQSQLQAIVANGLSVHGVETLHQQVKTISGEIPQADLYLITTKAISNIDLAKRLRSVAPASALFVIFQNGLDPDREFSEYLNSKNIYRAIMYLGVRRRTEVIIDYAFSNSPTLIGGPNLEVSEKLAALLTQAGHLTLATNEIRKKAWEKTILNSITNPLCALTGKTIGEIMNDSRFTLLLEEAIAVAKADGIDLGLNFFSHAIAQVKRASSHQGSMWEDVKAKRPTEIEQINGRIVTLGEKYGVSTPVHRQVILEVNNLLN
jgi:2-dehydropantoate 2-reductase